MALHLPAGGNTQGLGKESIFLVMHWYSVVFLEWEV